LSERLIEKAGQLGYTGNIDLYSPV